MQAFGTCSRCLFDGEGTMCVLVLELK